MVDSFNWILPARLAGSGLPGLLNELDADLRWLRAAGIQHIVSFTEKPLDSELAAGFICHHFPIKDMGISTPRDTQRFCEFVLKVLERQESVLVHCRAGLGRTGTMLACCLVSLGATADEAILRLRKINSYYIQNQTQEAMVGHYEEFLHQQAAEGLLSSSFRLAAGSHA